MPRPSPDLDDILARAERVFARQGYGETSLRQLLAATKISTTAFYARFDSKEDVLAALVDRMLADLGRRASESLATARSPEEGFERGIELLIATLSEHRVVMKLALAEASGAPTVRTTLARAYAALAGLLESQIRQVARRHGIPAGDVEVLAWALVGALQLQVMRWAVFEELDDAGLARILRKTARALLPTVARA